MTLLEAREAGAAACGDGEALRRVFRREDEWVAVVDTGAQMVTLREVGAAEPRELTINTRRLEAIAAADPGEESLSPEEEALTGDGFEAEVIRVQRIVRHEVVGRIR